LQDEIFVLPGDRFIFRQFSPVITVGGGRVLDAHPRRHRLRDREALPFLEILDRGTQEEILIALVEAAQHGMALDEIVSRTGWPAAEVERVAEAAMKTRVVVLNRKPLYLASASQVSGCEKRVIEAVSGYHRANPLREGITKEALRAEVDAGAEIFEGALRGMIAAGKIGISGDTIKSAGRSVTLSDEEARARGQIESAFERAGFAAPASKEVLAGVAVDGARAQKILQLLLREGVLVRVSQDLIYHRNALAKLSEALKTYARTHAKSIKVTDFKELAGISRKYAIPLLEYLDRTGVTRRQGDERVIL
jgi:selenocysteine-specific elongation factor